MTATLDHATVTLTRRQVSPRRSEFTFTAPHLTVTPVVLATYSEMAIALHYSGHSLTTDLTQDQVRELIVRGALAVGIDQVRQTDHAEGCRNLALLDGRIGESQWSHGADRIWSEDRAERCVGLAYHVGSAQ